MTKDLFKQIFCTNTGQVYRYTGSVDAGNPIADITKQFVTEVTDPLVSTIVVDVRGTYVLYTNIMAIVETPAFEYLMDLTDPVVEPVVEQPPVEEGGV